MIKKILSNLLRKLANDIDSGSYESNEEEILVAIDTLNEINHSREMSKEQACKYLHLSRASFDTYIRNGVLPKGRKRLGFKELSWTLSELDKSMCFAKENKII